jgi:tRNA(Ile2) C34 agmatinyltransferase TiaS
MSNPLRTLLDEFEKLVVEHGSAVVQAKHIALLRDEVARLERGTESLKEENAKLAAEISDVKVQLEKHTVPADCYLWKGVHIKRLPGGGYAESAYCPTCKLPMSSVGPRGVWICNHCDYHVHLNALAFREHLKTLK